MKFECPILVSRAQHRPTFSARVAVAADACQRRHLLWHHCLRGTTAWQCRLAGRAQMLEMVESIWCAGVVPTIDRATSAWRSSRRVRQHSLRCITTHRCRVAGRAQMSHNVDSFWRALHFRPSISPPVHGGAAVVCSKVAYDVPVLAVGIGETSADVGQCRPVEARGAVSTIDVAARAWLRRRRVRQGCLRCTSARCCRVVGRAQMSDNVDSS
jgi:hypothetical protein